MFGKVGKLTSMLSVTYGTSADLCYSGGADGRVYHWHGSTLSKAIEAHKGPVFAVQRVEKVRVHSHVTKWKGTQVTQGSHWSAVAILSHYSH